MAEIVLGIGTSHSPHLSTPFDQWNLHVERDHANGRLHFRGQVYRYEELEKARAAEGIAERELGEDRWRAKHEACEAAITELGETLARVAPDVIVIVGDDQEEMFLDDGMPAIAVFWGETVDRIPRQRRTHPSIEAAAWANHGLTRHTYKCVPALGEHIIRQSIAESFDVAQLRRQPENRGIGHAFNFVHTRLLNDKPIPMVPVTLNTYYPPNQPTPARCLAFGKTLKRAIESWDSDARVAVVASGGLTHFAIDEDLDHRVIDALAERDDESLATIPTDLLESGSSEIRNWITVGGAVDHLQMELLDYVPIHRTPAGTGTGMTFARWT
jgi:3-O-methylgallate 3,4-dioxygenase